MLWQRIAQWVYKSIREATIVGSEYISIICDSLELGVGLVQFFYIISFF